MKAYRTPLSDDSCREQHLPGPIWRPVVAVSGFRGPTDVNVRLPLVTRVDEHTKAKGGTVQATILVASADAAAGQVVAEAMRGLGSVSVCVGAVSALQKFEESSTDLNVTHQTMDDMSGIEFAESVREIEADTGNFSYIMVIGDELEAFDGAVNQWLPASEADVLLPSAARAALRLALDTQELRDKNAALRRLNTELEQGQLQDTITGLGNRRFAMQTLDDTIRQIEARVGAVCFLMIGIMKLDEVSGQYDQTISNELINAVSARIQNLVRPLDVVTYLGPGRFALILNQPSMAQCTAECYERIYDGVRLKSYKTAVGYLEIQVGMSLCASEAETGAPNPGRIVSITERNLDEAHRSGAIAVHHLTQAFAQQTRPVTDAPAATVVAKHARREFAWQLGKETPEPGPSRFTQSK
ncbi:MAG: hypothetical protein CMQ24_08235 [Gammaproteobacteria bacterium]|nr:hypothetical protein [Gammaproteobacteria bacterium]